MTSDARLAHVVSELEAASISCLVMGGHAVRYYGLVRNTNDADLHVSPSQWDDLPGLLARTKLFPGGSVLEGPSWRPTAFRRFCIGSLPDGREEWLEFWKDNHLLPPYDQALCRAERGWYGGQHITFLGMPDLIRSKETEREGDWRDIAVLEQFRDARSLAQVRDGRLAAADGLASLRSQAGLLSYFEESHVTAQNAGLALAQAVNPVTQAFLLPFAPEASTAAPVLPIEPVVLGRLRTTPPASPLHLALVEVVRRRYIGFRKDLDRRDKEATRAAQS